MNYYVLVMFFVTVNLTTILIKYCIFLLVAFLCVYFKLNYFFLKIYTFVYFNYRKRLYSYISLTPLFTDL